MIVEKLYLTNFRNYEKECIEFCDGINVIYGDNAQGKTNLVEALYYLSIGKSFKVAKDKDIIKFGTEIGSMKAVVRRLIGKIDIEIVLNQNKKQIKVNGGNLTKVGDLLGTLVTVFFSPNDLKLVKEAPNDRRKFLDIGISQLSKRYFTLLCKYQNILEQRNKLLKNKQDLSTIASEIDIWDRYLCQVAKNIIIQRMRYVNILSEKANNIHKFITNDKEELKLSYQTICEKEEDIEKALYNKLKSDYERDLNLGYTQSGPHKDDIKIYLNNEDVKMFGSQGQQRTVALSLKFAEKEILKEKIGEYPIMILDDVFSELDDSRNNKIMQLLRKGQTFITTTKKCSTGKQIKISAGKVEK